MYERRGEDRQDRNDHARPSYGERDRDRPASSSSSSYAKPPPDKFYTLLLDKETPRFVLDDLLDTGILKSLELAGYILRITIPEKDGLDTQFILDHIRAKDFMIPWKGFNDITKFDVVTTDEAKAKYKASILTDLSEGVLTIAALKVNLLLGEECDRPSDFLMIWTPDGAESVRSCSKDTGWLRTTIKLAEKEGIKIYNLNNSVAWDSVIDLTK